MRRYCGGCKLQKAALWLHIFNIMRQKAVCTINACHIGECSWVKAKVVAAILFKAAFEKRRRKSKNAARFLGDPNFRRRTQKGAFVSPRLKFWPEGVSRYRVNNQSYYKEGVRDTSPEAVWLSP